VNLPKKPPTRADKTASSKTPANRIAVLIGGGPLPLIMTNALVERFGPVTILEEDKEPLSVMVRRRIKMLGFVEAAGQVAFGVLLKLLHKSGQKRKQEIIAAASLNVERSGTSKIENIGNVNSESCRQALRRLAPNVVVAIGTRMIRRQTLQSTQAPFINYHAGLNPKYRGMNGGYWALATGDAENFGVTVHLIDEGVDTGQTIAAERLTPTVRDSFTTYPFLQAAVARELLVKAVEDILAGKLRTREDTLGSKQWFHPTIWGYIWTGLRRNVW